MTQTDDNDKYEEFLKQVAADLGITKVPEIPEISIQLTGEQLWLKSKIIARSMNMAYLEGKTDGLLSGKRIMEETLNGQKG